MYAGARSTPSTPLCHLQVLRVLDVLTYRIFLFCRNLQIHRQNVASEQQRPTKRRAPQAPTLPSLSSPSQPATGAAAIGRRFAL